MRTISEIGWDIKANWPKPFYGAIPYLNAMLDLSTINSQYGCEDARSIIRYFLSNAGTWKGPIARQVKAELNQMLDM